MLHDTFKIRETIILLSLAILILSWQAPALSSPCAQSDEGPDDTKRRHIEIDNVWSGTKVDFSAAHFNGKVYVAYYNSARIFSVAEINTSSGAVRKVALPNTFGGWDSHNYTMIEADEDGNLIVSGNMHASKLVYFLIEPNSLSVKSTAMIGKNEDRITYPMLLRVGERILFLYRTGGSGDGVWLANEWKQGRWSRVGEVFSGRSNEGHVSAYPSKFIKSKDGYVHVAIVWRRTPDVSTNYVVTYAKTNDFRKWLSHTGDASSSPLGPQGGDVVADICQNGGLTNNVQLAISPEGVPAITYTAYNDKGLNTVFVAHPEKGRWRSNSVSTANNRIEISGLGSIKESASGSAVMFTSSSPYLNAFFSKDGAYRVNLDARTLSPTCEPSKITSPRQESRPLPPGLAKATQNSIAVQGMIGAKIRWASQGVNNDLPRECTAAESLACNPPPTKLVLDIPMK